MFELSGRAATRYGFTLYRENPIAFRDASLIYPLFGALFAAVFAEPFSSALAFVFRSIGVQSAIQAGLVAAYAFIGFLWLLMLPAYPLLSAMLDRVMVKGRVDGSWLAAVREGDVDLRTNFVRAASLLISCAPFAVFVAAAMAATGPSTAPIARIVIWFLAFPLSASTALYLSVRFSSAAAATFAERRIVFFDAWTRTSGRSWRIARTILAATSVIVVAHGIVFAVIGFGIFGVLSGCSGGGLSDFGELLRAPRTAIDADCLPVRPAMVLGAAIYGPVSTFLLALMFGPGAAAYLDWKSNS